MPLAASRLRRDNGKYTCVLAQLCTQQEQANLGPRLLFNLVRKARRKKSHVIREHFDDDDPGFLVKLPSAAHNIVTSLRASDRDRDNQWNQKTSERRKMTQKQLKLTKATKERERSDKTSNRAAGQHGREATQ